MENTYTVMLDPCTKSSVSLRLYKNVKNVPELRQQIIVGTLKCCIVKPNLIVDPMQIVIAANKATLSEVNNQLTTRSIYPEILYNLSISKNISQSLLKFGIDDKETNLLIVMVNKNDDLEDNNSVYNLINGEHIDIKELESLRDERLIKTSYKINDNEGQVSKLLDSVISRIVTKDFVSH